MTAQTSQARTSKARKTAPKKSTPKKAGGKKTKSKAVPAPAEPMLARALRVDHAGEYGAQRIYEGQLAALEGRAKPETIATIREMLEQEREHLAAFDELLCEERVRPTALQPAWHVGGWLLGVASGVLGERAAMACTIAVEEVIEGHYADQVAAMEQNEVGDKKLRARLARFAEEEAEHRETARAHGGEEVAGWIALRFAVRSITKTAIRLSERI